MAGLDFPQMGGNITPEAIMDDWYQRGMAAIDQRYEQQWNEVNRRASTLGPRRHAEMLNDIQARSRAELGDFHRAAQARAAEFQLIDRLAQQDGFDPYEVKMRIALGPEVEAAMFPKQVAPRSFEQKFAEIQAHENRLRRRQAEFFTDPGGQRIRDWKKFWFAEERTRPTIYRRSYDPTDKDVYEFEGRRGLYKIAGAKDMQDLFQIQREMDVLEQLREELFNQPNIATRVRGAMLRRKRDPKHDSLTTRIQKSAGADQPKPRAPKVKQRTPQPPTEYPDATWDDKRKMWTVVRDGRLMGVK